VRKLGEGVAETAPTVDGFYFDRYRGHQRRHEEGPLREPPQSVSLFTKS
jgi:hypothetical protein